MTLEIHVRRECSRCEGDGTDPDPPHARCGRCNGGGKEVAWMSAAEVTSHITDEQVRRARHGSPGIKQP